MAVKPLPTSAEAGNPAPEIDLGASDSQQVAAKTLVGYGDSGLGKSTNLMFAAKWLYEQHGKPVRLVSAEDSSKLIFQPLIDVGVVEALFVTKSKNPLRTFRKLSSGEWPVFDASGKLVEWQSWQNQACAYICEGLTSWSEQLLEFMRENHLFLREQTKDAVEIGGEKLAAASQTAYGVTQSEMLAILKGFANIPGISRVLWSSHEVSAVEEGTGLKIRGPALVGSAKTAHLPKYIGTLLHFDEYTVENVRRPRVYFVRHPDPKYPEVSYPAKVTLSPEARRVLQEKYAAGFFEPTLEAGLDQFLQAEAEALKKAVSDVAAWKKKVDASRLSLTQQTHS